MKDFSEHFKAVHAAADGTMEPARELLRPRKVGEKIAQKPVDAPQNWMAEVEEKQEEDAERFRKLREKTEGKTE